MDESSKTEYLIPAGYAAAEFVEKRSRFIGQVWPVRTEAEAREKIEAVKKQHHDARHNCWCYALRDGTLRYSDDGEPQGTAGQPMLEVLRGQGVTDAVIVVTRYFGGILLGTGGLARAYTKGARDALSAAGISVERLWDRADLIVDADVDTLSEQLADTVKSRGHVASSSSVAIKQSMAFGQTFIEATSALLGPEVPKGLLLAEGLRFQSRLAAAQELLSIDDVLTIDELLDLLALESITCSIEPTALVAQLKAERFRRSGRFLLQLPRGMGRVRAATVTDEMLLEHATAWCESRAEL